MTSLFRKFTWWLRRRRKERELDEELQFHLEQEADERLATGLPADQAAWAARRDLGNVTRLRAVVIAANLVGAPIFGTVAARTEVFSPEARHAFTEIS